MVSIRPRTGLPNIYKLQIFFFFSMQNSSKFWKKIMLQKNAHFVNFAKGPPSRAAAAPFRAAAAPRGPALLRDAAPQNRGAAPPGRPPGPRRRRSRKRWIVMNCLSSFDGCVSQRSLVYTSISFHIFSLTKLFLKLLRFLPTQRDEKKAGTFSFPNTRDVDISWDLLYLHP